MAPRRFLTPNFIKETQVTQNYLLGRVKSNNIYLSIQFNYNLCN